jgi:hypothetical protein
MLSRRVGMRVFALALAMCTQTDRGSIDGTAPDPAGAVIANASVEANTLRMNGMPPSSQS